MTQLKDAKFDLLLVDPNEMCGFVIAHILGVPYAVFSTGLWYPAEVGAPAPLSYVPEFNSLLTDQMSLVQRITNTAVYLVSRFGVQYLVLPKYERIMRKHGVEPRVAMQDLVQGSRLWMLSTDLALEFPRPTLPHVVYVGGVLTKPASPLPQIQAPPERHGRSARSFGTVVRHGRSARSFSTVVRHAIVLGGQRVAGFNTVDLFRGTPTNTLILDQNWTRTPTNTLILDQNWTRTPTNTLILDQNWTRTPTNTLILDQNWTRTPTDTDPGPELDQNSY
uniref:2-hydroxyacylsphingosine 1-beta-galactosyltransferase-like n=1 Tax=Oncorhynchus gorbuscha TaxID=8017 RepID=UPI001EAF07C5|nr:2-hydroxyacylsphingosine 1-beta-galactosyltransferase-like [Oncorhynchus gorbuscha]